MKKIQNILVVFSMLLLSVSVAGATTYDFSAGTMQGLDHYRYYKWQIGWSVPEGEKIVGASLFFDDIRNWQWEENDLYVHLLDNPNMSGGRWIAPGVKRYWDGQGGGDNFDGQGILLHHWENLPDTAQDITYNFL